MQKTYSILSALLLIAFTSGCSSTHQKWGEHATLTPGWNHLKDVAVSSAKDPHTWMPLVGAAVFGLGGLDQRASDWATQHNPLFTSNDKAQDASDLFEDISRANLFITAMAAQSGQGKEGLINKSKGLMIAFAARRVNGEITESIKIATARERPDKSDLKSFPSGHTSNAAIYASLAAQNVQYMNLTQSQQSVWRASSYAVAGLTGWARVEGLRHYPSDVLAGYALGNFLGIFIHDAFINPQYQEHFQVGVALNRLDKSELSITYLW